MKVKLHSFGLRKSKTDCHCFRYEKRPMDPSPHLLDQLIQLENRDNTCSNPQASPCSHSLWPSPSAAPRTRHIALPGLAGEPWDLGNPNGPQSYVTDTPLRRPNSPASLRAALGQSTVAISEEQARTARVGTPLPRHTPGCSAAACLAQACHLYPVCVNMPFAAVQPLWMFHWPIFPCVHLTEQH